MDTNSGININEHFVKQRRNLILFSCLVIFVNIAGAKIEQVNLLGNVLAIARPDSVALLFTIVLVYFLIRYAQYSHAIKNKGVRDAFKSKLWALLSVHLLDRVYHAHILGERIDEQIVLLTGKKLKGPSDFLVHHFLYEVEGMEKRHAHITIRLRLRDTTFDYRDEAFSVRELAIPYLRSFLYVVFQTHLITEYVLPLLLALVALASFASASAHFLRLIFGVS